MPSRAYERRNERARELGYKSYYDYRIHDHGRIPAGRPAPTGAERARLRGHRSYQDLLGAVRSGRADTFTPLVTERDPKTGRVTRIQMLVLDDQGNERIFYVSGRQASQANLARLRDELNAAGIRYMANPSLDVFARTSDDEEPEDDFDYEDESEAA